MAEARYFNAPVQLLEGFLDDPHEALDKILYFGIYDYALTFSEEPSLDDFCQSADFLNVDLARPAIAFAQAQKLHNSFKRSSPKFGIRTEIFWNYRKSNKARFELVCLLAFLAFKSIIQNDAFKHVTNKYLLSRMAGLSNSIEIECLPDPIKMYSTEHYLKKIKEELEMNWGLKLYGKSRGFYISFQMSLEDLIFQVEKKKREKKNESHKQEKDAAYERAIKRLKTSSKNLDL